jgi:hypothetical protein
LAKGDLSGRGVEVINENLQGLLDDGGSSIHLGERRSQREADAKNRKTEKESD